MYTSLARFGYGISKILRPSKVKTLLTPAVKKATRYLLCKVLDLLVVKKRSN
jgi:DNA repair protein RadC